MTKGIPGSVDRFLKLMVRKIAAEERSTISLNFTIPIVSLLLRYEMCGKQLNAKEHKKRHAPVDGDPPVTQNRAS